MSLFLKIKNVFNRGQPIERYNNLDFLRELGLDIDNIESSSDLSAAIYFICLKHLSETMGKMPWFKKKVDSKKGKEKVFDRNLNYLLNTRPNPYYNALTLWSCAELNRLHYGNSYIYIEINKQTGYPKHLWLLPSEEIEIWVDDGGFFGKQNAIWYIWKNDLTGTTFKFSSYEIMHLKTSTTFNGISGVPVKEILKTQISSQKHSTAFLKRLYANNMFGSKVLLYNTVEVSKKNMEKITNNIADYSKSGGNGKFIPLPAGVEAKLMDMKLADAQFFENNKSSALQLAAAFGIKPNVINNYDKSSYSNSETQQLDFFVNTLQPLFAQYEQEISYKLLGEKQLREGFSLEINSNVLFKMDSKTKAEVYSKYATNFIMTPNEVREALDLPYLEGADKLLGNGNAIGIDDISKQYGGSEEK